MRTKRTSIPDLRQLALTIILGTGSNLLLPAAAFSSEAGNNALSSRYPMTHSLNDPDIVKGREIFEVACNQCHSASIAFMLRNGREGWQEKVEEMTFRGAQLNHEEVDLIATFLATELGPGITKMNSGKLPPAAALGKRGTPSAETEGLLPKGKGQAEVASLCQACHDLGRVVSVRRSQEEWREITENMLARFIPVDHAEIQKISMYLSHHFGNNAH
ncbi:MAG: hypothetical protein QNK25_06950 [Desulfobacterales bacterium]|nr:hypothetical protein [Desulfobacterales bacterium]